MKIVDATGLPPALGDFSHAVVSNGLIFTSGTVGLTPELTFPGDGGIEAQTSQTIETIAQILATQGASLESIVSATVYLASMDDYAGFTDAWSSAFGDHKPARATVRADMVAPELLIEIQVVAEAP